MGYGELFDASGEWSAIIWMKVQTNDSSVGREIVKDFTDSNLPYLDFLRRVDRILCSLLGLI